MNLNNVDISKLPSDIRRQFKQLQVLHAEKKIQNKAKQDFLSFVKCVWPDFIEGSHHRHIACLLYTSPSPRDVEESRMPSSA